MNQRTKITRGSGNVFVDLGIPNPEEALAKAELAHEIARIIREGRLSQAAAAGVLGIDQPKVSALVRRRLSGFSLDRLLRFLIRLDYDVRIAIRPRRGSGAARVRVLAA
jgi:predicted XRE-type DNA-binding protein